MPLTQAAVKSWKTTAMGIVAFLTVALPAAQALLDTDPLTVPDWNLVVGAGSVMLALLFARDNNVSSENAGVAK